MNKNVSGRISSSNLLTGPKLILFFDTSNFDWLEFALIGAKEERGFEKVWQQKIKAAHFDSEAALPALIEFLKKHRIRFDHGAAAISKIYFVSGPGSFSGIRVGASIALALQFAWKVPVFALEKSQVPKRFSAETFAKTKTKKINSVPELDYGAAPNITKEKKKKLKHT